MRACRQRAQVFCLQCIGRMHGAVGAGSRQACALPQCWRYHLHRHAGDADTRTCTAFPTLVGVVQGHVLIDLDCLGAALNFARSRLYHGSGAVFQRRIGCISQRTCIAYNIPRANKGTLEFGCHAFGGTDWSRRAT